jgi:hypothetical protein
MVSGASCDCPAAPASPVLLAIVIEPNSYRAQIPPTGMDRTSASYSLINIYLVYMDSSESICASLQPLPHHPAARPSFHAAFFPVILCSL